MCLERSDSGGGTGVLSVDGKEYARKSIPHSIAFLIAIDESFDIGIDTRTDVDDSYKLPFQFTEDRQADLERDKRAYMQVRCWQILLQKSA
jgi:hypothetical protein